MSQWRTVLKMMQNATGGWVSTHDIYDELRVKNPSQRIEEIERQGYEVEREVAWINGKRAARYRLRASGHSPRMMGTVGEPGSEAAAPPELSKRPAQRGVGTSSEGEAGAVACDPSGDPLSLFEPPPPHNENDMWKAA